jgi:predicted amidohydrolase
MIGSTGNEPQTQPHCRRSFAMRIIWCLFGSVVCLHAAAISFTVAGLRVTPERWDKEANFAKLAKYAREGKAHGATLVITPEGFLEGYVGNTAANPDTTEERYRAAAEGIDGPLMTRVRALARELKIYLLAGFAESRGGNAYNSAAVFSPDGEVALHYSKMHNAHDEPFNTKGVEFPVAETPLGRWGALICYDRRLPETARILAIKGAQFLLVPAWGSSDELNDALMRTRAFENSVWVAFVHPKRCLFIDPRGKVVAKDRGEGDELVTARIDLDERVGRGPIRDRRPELYREILK